MNLSLFSAASHLNALEQWQTVIASNLANAPSTGHLPMAFSIEAPRDKVINNGERQTITHVPQPSSIRSMVDGPVRATGNPTDLAVIGEAFFTLDDGAGGTLYTRDGEFHIDATGTLVNKAGYAVMTNQGKLQLPVAEGPVTILQDGSVHQGDERKGILQIMRAQFPENLNMNNGTYLTDPNGNAGMEEAENFQVLQGYVMGSGVQPLYEMVNMIQVARAYEMSQKIIHESDERVSKAIQAFSN